MDEHRRQSDVSRISKALDADDDRRRSVALSAPVVHQRSGKMGRVASFFGGDKEEVESLRNQLAAAQAEAAALRMDIQGTKEAHKKQIDDLVNQHALEIRGRQMQFRNAIQAAKEEAAAEREAVMASAQLQASDTGAQMLHQAQERSAAAIAALKSQHQAAIQELKETMVAEVARVRGETRAERDLAVAEAQAVVAAARQETSDVITHHEDELSSLRAEMEAVKADCRTQLAEAESRHAVDLEAAATLHRQAIAELRSKHDNQRVDADKAHAVKLEGELTRLQKEIQSLNAEVVTLRGASESAETLAAMHDTLRSEIARLSDEHAQTIAGLKAAHQQELATVTSNLQSESQAQLASALASQQKQHEAEIFSLKLAADSESGTLKSELAVLSDKYLALQRDLDRERLEGKQQLEKQRASLEVAAVVQMSELKALHASEIDQLRRSHEVELESVRRSAAGDIEDYRVQFETISNQFSALERSHAAALEAARQRVAGEVDVAVSRAKREYEAALTKLRTSHTSEVASLRGQLVALALEASQERQAALDEAAATASVHLRAALAGERQKQESVRATIGEACRELKETVAAMKKDAVDLETQHARMVEAIKARHVTEVAGAVAKARQDASEEQARLIEELKLQHAVERELEAKRLVEERAEANATVVKLQTRVAALETDLVRVQAEAAEKQDEFERLLDGEKRRHSAEVDSIRAQAAADVEEVEQRLRVEQDDFLRRQHARLEESSRSLSESTAEQLAALRDELQCAHQSIAQLTCSEIVSTLVTKSVAVFEFEELKRQYADEMDRLRSEFEAERARADEIHRGEMQAAVAAAQVEASRQFDVVLDNQRAEWTQLRNVEFEEMQRAMALKFVLDTQSAKQVLTHSLQALVTDHEAGMSAIYAYCGSLSERVDIMLGWLDMLKTRCRALSAETSRLDVALAESKASHQQSVAQYDQRIAELEVEHQRLLDSLSEVAVDGRSEAEPGSSRSHSAPVDLTTLELVEALKRRLKLSEASRKDLMSRVQSQVKAAVAAAVEIERQSQCEHYETELARAQVAWMNKLSAEQVAQDKVLTKLDGEWRDKLARVEKQKAAEIDIVRAECESRARERVNDAIQPLLSQIRALKAQVEGSDLSRSVEAWQLMQHLARPLHPQASVSDRADSRGPTPEPPNLDDAHDETASLEYSHTVSIVDDAESKTDPEERAEAPRKFVRNRVLPPSEPNPSFFPRNVSPSPSVGAFTKVVESPGRPPVRSRSATRLSTARSPGTVMVSPHSAAGAPKFPITSGNPKPGFNSSAKRLLM